MYMFNAKHNDGFYDMGLAVMKAIGERIEQEGIGRSSLVDPEKEVRRDWKEEQDVKGRTVWVEV